MLEVLVDLAGEADVEVNDFNITGAAVENSKSLDMLAWLTCAG